MKSSTSPIGDQSSAHASPSCRGLSRLNCQAAFLHIAQDCLRLIRDNRRFAMDADPEAIHAMRIELTRLRAAVSFFSPMARDAAWRRLRKEVRWLNETLGKARDLDVTTSQAERKRYRRWASRSLSGLERTRDKCHQSLTKKLSSPRYERLMIALDRWIRRGPWLTNGNDLPRLERIETYSEVRLSKWRKGIHRKGRHLRRLRSQQLHRLRIRCKLYRYIVAGLQSLKFSIPPQELAFCDVAKQVHRALGDLRDLKRLRRAARATPPGYREAQRELLRLAERSFHRSQ